MPDMGANYLLTKVLGTQKALELIFAGDPILPQQALELGLVAHVVPHDDLLPFCKAMARKFAEGPSVAMALAKRAVYRAESGTLEQGPRVRLVPAGAPDDHRRLPRGLPFLRRETPPATSREADR